MRARPGVDLRTHGSNAAAARRAAAAGLAGSDERGARRNVRQSIVTAPGGEIGPRREARVPPGVRCGRPAGVLPPYRPERVPSRGRAPPRWPPSARSSRRKLTVLAPGSPAPRARRPGSRPRRAPGAAGRPARRGNSCRACAGRPGRREQLRELRRHWKDHLDRERRLKASRCRGAPLRSRRVPGGSRGSRPGRCLASARGAVGAVADHGGLALPAADAEGGEPPLRP